MTKTFTLRVDLESEKGIKLGLPRLLDLLKRYNIKASFYLVMGGESNIIEILKYRNKLKSSGERSIKVWSIKDKIRMTLFPKDFVKNNIHILRRVIADGHELGIHGWKHREWTRGLDKINTRERIIMAKKKYFYFFGKKPVSFCSPGFNTNEKVLRVLDDEGIKFISDFQDKKVKEYFKIKNVPITILGEERTPIIEFLVGKGKSDEEILSIIKEMMQKEEICSFYMHDLFEARFKLPLLEEIFKYVKKNKILNKRIIDY
ncbi:polysaccharide deacetylase family protein [Candidatus Pacearchaeota archaeon]|nr:polysaccharide deacetylase family protein [Candidatus Pacearchaeota archaeon]